MSHTPGPWRVGEMCGGTINIEADTTPRRITVGRTHVFDTSAEAEANARLIAAAPDLLAQLKNMRALVRGELGECVDCERADAAIAKAEGR